MDADDFSCTKCGGKYTGKGTVCRACRKKDCHVCSQPKYFYNDHDTVCASCRTKRIKRLRASGGECEGVAAYTGLQNLGSTKN